MSSAEDPGTPAEPSSWSSGRPPYYRAFAQAAPAAPLYAPPPLQERSTDWAVPRWLGRMTIVAILVALLAVVVAGFAAARSFAVPVATTTTYRFVPNTSQISKPADVQGILAKVEPGVVLIQVQTTSGRLGQGEALGTGMLLSADGLVLTNDHVVAGGTNVQVTLAGQGQAHTATVVGEDPTHDVAVIKIQGVSGLPTVQLGSSASLQVGDGVIAIGNALGLGGSPTVTEGIVSALNRTVPGGRGSSTLTGLVQTDAAINPGNSGGPLVNSSGQVIGINTEVSAQGQNIGFALAIDQVKPLLAQLEKGGTTQPSAAAQSANTTG
jgi:S1-C subfamily serine protease